MRRLVYSPKAYAWVRTEHDGLFDLTPYLTRGRVQRVVNMPSTAEIEFRNPNMMFTSRSRTKKGPFFKPMDPMTIWLERIRGFPVQVFTGYIDTAPYLQLYPSTVKITASCTLKRLNNIYWDMGLNYVNNWLQKYGWQGDRNTGQVYNVRAEGKDLTPKDQLSDGSIGELLFATLTDVADWPEDRIHIERLPEHLITQVTNIWTAYAQDAELVGKDIEKVIKRYIGTGNYATGGLGSGDSSGAGPSSVNLSEVQKFNHVYPAHYIENSSGKAFLSFNEWRAIFEALGESPRRAYTYATIARGEGGGGKMGAYPGIVQHDPGDGNVGYGGVQLTPHAWGGGEITVYMNKLGGTTALRNPVITGMVAIKLNDLSGGHFEPWGGGGNSGANRSKYLDEDPPANVRSVLNREKQASNDPEDPRGNKSANQASVESFTSGGKLKNNSDSPVASKSNNVGTTRFDAIVAEANRMDHLAQSGTPYSNARPPSDTTGYDCSSSCAQLMQAAGYQVPYFSTANAPQYMVEGKGDHLTFWNNDYSGTGGNSVHMFAEIDGRQWGTGDGLCGHWYPHSTSGFKPYHLKFLDEPYKVPRGADLSTGGGVSQGDTGASWNDVLSTSKAAAFVQSFQFPGLMESFESMALTGPKALLNDTPLFPFIDQLSKAALRSFQSLPNGDFYAFYPDYFGTIGDRQPYWEIDDIEILEGQIMLTDESLATHVFAVGDTMPFTPGVDSFERLTSTGVVNIFNKEQSGFIAASSDPKQMKAEERVREQHRKTVVSDPAACMRFLQKYGARPHLEESPFVRSRFYEAFLAWQIFDLMWSRQFITDFTFTFMPEIYPGGLISFPDHGVQCYVDQVSHEFDYESGFTTTASLSAPATLTSDKLQSDPLSHGLVRAGAAQ